MKFFLREHYFLTTKLSQEAVAGKLYENTDTNDVGLIRIFALAVGKKFFGNISGNGFKIFRATRFSNRYNPAIKGIIFTSANKTMIEIKIGMNVTGYLWVAWCFIVILLSMSSIITSCVKNSQVQPGAPLALIVGTGFFLFYVNLTRRFNKKSKKLLKTILVAEEVRA